jgi:O-antigen/teichoic acid export membrane protein
MLKKLFSSAFLLMLSTLIAKGFILILNILIARYTSKDTYGTFAFLRSTINLFETTFSSAVNPFAVKESSKENSSKVSVLAYGVFYAFTALIISTSCLLLWASSQLIGSLSSFDFLTLQIVLTVVILISLTLLNGYSISVYIGKGIYKVIFFSTVISIVLSTAVIFYTYEDINVEIALFYMLIYQLTDLTVKVCNALINHTHIIKNIEYDVLFQKTKGVLNTVKPVIVGSAINAFVFWFVRYVTANSENGFVALAEFDVSFQMFMICSILLNIICNIVLRNLTKLHESGSNLKQLLSYAMQYMSLSCLLFVGVGYFLYDYFLLLYGDKYTADLFLEVTLICLFYSVALAFNRVMVVMNKTYQLFYVALTSAIVMGAYILTVTASAESLAISFSVYYLTSCVVYLYIFKYRLIK